VILTVLLSLAATAPGCAWRRPDLAPAARGEAIRIGVPLPLTGAKAGFGEIKRNSYEMALEEVNAAGGVDGRPLEFIFRDTAGDPDAAAAVAEELITADKVAVLAGGYSSSCCLAIARVAQRYGVPYLIDSAAADSVTQQGWDYVFRLNPPAALVAQGLISFFSEIVHPRSMAVIYEHSDFGSAMAEAMRGWCRDSGVDVPVFESYEAGAIDFTPILTKVKQAAPDVVYMVSYLTDASLIMRQARSQGLVPKLFAGGACGFVLPRFIENAGCATENVVAAALWAPTLDYPGALTFAETYRARYGEYPTYHGAGSYACVHVAADALLRAASEDPERIRVALSDTDLMTAFGPIRFESFDDYMNQNALGTIVLQIQNGVHEVVWPPEAATADYVYPDPAGAGEGQTGR